MSSNQTQTALITGASSGIGFELVRCFARDKFKVIMVARQPEKLQESATKLNAEFPDCQVVIIPCDLSVAGSPDELYAEVKKQNLRLDILVNDAGFGEHGFFTETDLKKELQMIQLNIASLTHLTKLYLPEMLQRKSGRVLQLGSVVSFMPAPLMAVYAATKAYVLSFTEALQNELKDSGVTMTVLCPPATDTNFFKVADAENTKAAQGDLATPEEVAQAGYDALMKGEARALPTFTAQMQAASRNITPDSVLAAQMRKQMEEDK
jgi:short-subunit dehydrogenase